ncbi:MAG: hypothetical protein ACXVNM_14140 [Bacteroidia bacterium]
MPKLPYHTSNLRFHCESFLIGSTTLYIFEDGQFFVKLTNNLQVVYAKTILSHWGEGYYRPFIFFDNNGNFVLSRVTGGGGSSSHDLSIEKYNSSCNQIWYQYIYVNSDCFIDMDNQYNIWAAGRHYIGATTPVYSVITQIIYDQSILHSVDGLAVKANSDFYVIGHCSLGSSLDSYSCSPQGSVFMARLFIVLILR